MLRSDLKGNWERIFHEEYRRVYAKTIKGYTFIGQHWDDGSGMEGRYGWTGPLGDRLTACLKGLAGPRRSPSQRQSRLLVREDGELLEAVAVMGIGSCFLPLADGAMEVPFEGSGQGVGGFEV